MSQAQHLLELVPVFDDLDYVLLGIEGEPDVGFVPSKTLGGVPEREQTGGEKLANRRPSRSGSALWDGKGHAPLLEECTWLPEGKPSSAGPDDAIKIISGNHASHTFFFRPPRLRLDYRAARD
jgi:hypothetical protein